MEDRFPVPAGVSRHDPVKIKDLHHPVVCITAHSTADLLLRPAEQGEKGLLMQPFYSVAAIFNSDTVVLV